MQKYIRITLFLLILNPGLYSQTENSNLQDPAAEFFLDKVAKTFSSNEAYQIEFRYELESLADNYKSENYGSVVVKNEKYKLKTAEGEVYFNGEKIWTFNQLNEEVYISKPDPENLDQLMTVPFILLKKYKDYFKYRMKEDYTSGVNKYYEIDLYPINLDSNYSILRLRLENPSERLFSLSLQQKNGVNFRIFISQVILKVKINDSAFTWDKDQYPDVLEVEL